MLLQDRGLLDINDPVSMYIPDTPDHWDGIRIHYLLNHRSGIPSEGAYDTTDPVDLALTELVRRIMELPLQFEPGEDMTYSNNGYITLSYIIEQVSGLSYDHFLKQNIFQPAGMSSTGQHNAHDVFPLLASGSTRYADRRIHYEGQNIHNRFGAGSLHSTTEDIFRWLRSFYTRGSILSNEASQSMMENDYGVVRAELQDRTVVGHGGRELGFISYTIYYADEDVTVIFLSNYDRTPMVTLPPDLAAIVFDEPYTVPQTIQRIALPVSSETLVEFTGTYALEWEDSWTYTVFLDGDQLFYTSSFPEETVELYFEGDDTFFLTSRSADSFIFTRDEDGLVNGLRMYTLEGMYDNAVRIQLQS
jgi:CubicO group peptidase (beta-lactamase class C family)